MRRKTKISFMWVARRKDCDGSDTVSFFNSQPVWSPMEGMFSNGYWGTNRGATEQMTYKKFKLIFNQSLRMNWCVKIQLKSVKMISVKRN